MKRQTPHTLIALLTAITMVALVMVRPGPCSILGCFTKDAPVQASSEDGSCCPKSAESGSTHNDEDPASDASCDCGCEYLGTGNADAITTSALNAQSGDAIVSFFPASTDLVVPATAIACCNRDRSPPVQTVPAYILYASLLN